MDIQTTENGDISLLCLDGGGVRGLSALRILQRIMESVNPAEPPKPCEYFDMIAGTSTGGLIAIMLGRLKMSVSDCIDEYQKLSAIVFNKFRHRINWKGKLQGRFNHEALELCIKDLLKRLNLSEDELLKEDGGNPSCKIIVIFSNYYSKTWGKSMFDRIKIWEAARATSAAPSFFDPIVIDGQTFADGATGANNPIYELWSEASSTFSTSDTWELEDNIKCLISIGTGIPSLKPFGPGIKDVAAALKAIATESEAKALQFQRQRPFLAKNNKYFRFNVVQGLEDIGLEEAGRLREIEACTDSYCATPSVMQQIDVCVKNLKQRSWIKEAIASFERRTENPLVKGLYASQSSIMAKSELDGYIHTKAFQKWLTQESGNILCTTVAERTGASPPLAACLAKKIETMIKCNVIYIDCFWELQTPHERSLKNITNLSKEPKIAQETAGDKIMESFYCALFRRCPIRHQILKTYADNLESPESNASFKSQMIATGIPPKVNILGVLQHLLANNSEGFLVSIDRTEEIRDTSWTWLASIISSVATLPYAHRVVKLLICGEHNITDNIGPSFIPIVAFDTENNECLDSLSFAEINVRKSQVPPAAEGTTSWIWSHQIYLPFAAQDSGILWVRGKPGSGKSVLARSIQRQLLDASSQDEVDGKATLVGDWFYHRRQGGGYIRHESFVRSLLFHFLEQCPQLLIEFFKDAYRTMDPREPANWTYDMLVDILKQICHSSYRVFGIIDALDEAESMEILELIKLLTDQTKHSRAKFIILSRPNTQIERQLDEDPCIVVEEENGNDIKRLIELGLASLHKAIHSLDYSDATTPPRQRNNRIPRHANLKQPRYRSLATTMGREKKAIGDIRDVLTAKAQGSILWVKLVLDKLTQEAKSNEGSTLEDLRDIVNQIPEELAEYYRQIVEELTANKPAKRTQEIRRALMWICAAAEIGDVTLEGLWEALAMLKDDFISDTLDGIWQKQIIISSFDELWRKIHSICGPFIEIFNPGLSAEESRIYRYGATSIVQLTHQSVRDFFCNSQAAGSLYFSLDEAKDLARRHLERYIDLSNSDRQKMDEAGPQEPQVVIDWLNDQKLLQLAMTSTKTSRQSEPNVKWKLIAAPTGTAEEILVSIIHDCVKLESSTPPTDYVEKIAVGRLIYHTCIEGLVTAVRNIMLLMGSQVKTDVHGHTSMDIIIRYCILFVASSCVSKNIKVEFNLPFGDQLSTSRPAPLDFGGLLEKRTFDAAVFAPSLMRNCTCSSDVVTEPHSPETQAVEIDRLSEYDWDENDLWGSTTTIMEQTNNEKGDVTPHTSHSQEDRLERPELNNADPKAAVEVVLSDEDFGTFTFDKLSDFKSMKQEQDDIINNMRKNVHIKSDKQLKEEDGEEGEGEKEEESETTSISSDDTNSTKDTSRDDKKKLVKESASRRYSTNWVNTIWKVNITLKKEGRIFPMTVEFKQWCYFLDLVCGSKRSFLRARIQKDARDKFGEKDGLEDDLEGDDCIEEHDGELEMMMAPIEDVEDAIFTAMTY